jgi:hypothetical protein
MIYELDLDFGYDKQIYGASRENSVVSRTYSAGISTYIFELTGIDLNFSSSKDTTSTNDRFTPVIGTDIISTHSYVTTTVYGIGIKQMLLPKNNWVMPLLSIGYAKEFVNSSSDYTKEDTTTKIQSTSTYSVSKQRVDSVFGTFVLQFKLSDRFSLKGTVKTLFPAFEINKAKDNMKYLFGFSCVF